MSLHDPHISLCFPSQITKEPTAKRLVGVQVMLCFFVADLNSANSHKDAATTLPHAGDIPLGGGKCGGGIAALDHIRICPAIPLYGDPIMAYWKLLRTKDHAQQ